MLFLAAAAPAATMQHGDVIGVGDVPGIIIGEPIWQAFPWLRGPTALSAPVGGVAYGIAAGPNGRFSITTQSAVLISMDRDFHITSGPFRYGTGIVFDRAGTLFLHDLDGHLVELDAAGQQQRTAELGLPDQFVALDLDRDQCTLYVVPFEPESAIRRFDVCTWTALSDFSATRVGGGGLRADRDGTVLASSGNRILRFSRTGQVLAEYAFDLGGPIGPFAFDADDGSIWAAAGYRTWKLDLGARHVVAGPFETQFQILGYGVVDEPRAALLPVVPPASVPATDAMWLALLAVALAVASVARLPHS
ncbi:MAG TPA: hypothetical protein VN605_01495 [Thermoanaerobaculia bacterium]|nr:hypothetical protein [Thermoanaerobaculia bacterium]